MGEFLVGEYLKIIKKCDVVSYNVRPPETGIEGLGELDVVGLDFPNKAAYLCEVSTHLGGLEYGKGYEDSASESARSLSVNVFTRTNIFPTLQSANSGFGHLVFRKVR